MDHKPGPNIARATPVVASISQSGLLPGSVSIFQTSVRPTEVPAMGVHKPAINRIPAPNKRIAAIVTLIGGGSLRSVKLARTISVDPTTTRIRSNPVPGQPPANVEYRRRKEAPFRTTLSVSAFRKARRKPKKG